MLGMMNTRGSNLKMSMGDQAMENWMLAKKMMETPTSSTGFVVKPGTRKMMALTPGEAIGEFDIPLQTPRMDLD